MQNRLLLSILFLAFSILSRGQANFDSAKVRIKIIKSLNNFPSDDDTMLLTKQFGFSRTTIKTITSKELIELTNFPKAAVRMAALEALVDRHNIAVPALLLKNRSDTVNFILVQFECNQGYMTFVDRLLFFLRPNSGWTNYFVISKEQNDMIASILEERKISMAYYFISRQK